MKKHISALLCFSLISASSLLAQIDINFYSLLWEDKDVAVEKLKQLDFEIVEEKKDEESVDIRLALNDLTIALFCYNESRDSIVELNLIIRDKETYADILDYSIQFDTTEYTLSKPLLMGYDAEVFTNDIDWEISNMPIYSYSLFMISISTSPTFDWRKEMMEEGGKHKYKPTEDPKHCFRKIAQIKMKDGLTLEERMKSEFGELDFKEKDINRIKFEGADFSKFESEGYVIENKSEFTLELERIKETEKYQEYKNYVEKNVLTDQSYQKEVLKYGLLLQSAMNLDKNRYNEMHETERDILSIYMKNDWIYTLVMLDFLSESILK